MMGRSTFRTGGIPLPPPLSEPRSRDITSVSLPVRALVPLLQHRGLAADPLVQPGQEVQEGECIARSRETPGAHVFSPIPGTVAGLVDHVLPDGRACKACLIDLGGSFRVSASPRPRASWEEMTPAELRAMTGGQGIVDLASDHRSLAESFSLLPAGVPARIVVNAFPRDPWNSVGVTLMETRAAELAEAIRILCRALESRSVHVALPASCIRSSRTLGGLLADLNPRRCLLEERYPQAEPRYLMQALFHEDLPAGRSAPEHGVFITDPETLLSLREAVLSDRPQLDRLVVIAGAGITRPGIYRVRIGTPLQTLLDEAGGTLKDCTALVSGGALKGVRLESPAIPVTRDMSTILALTPREIQDRPVRDCMRCGACAIHCPAGLEPSRMMRLSARGLHAQAMAEGLADCSDCGICSWVCPSRLPLWSSLGTARSLAQETMAGPPEEGLS